MHRFFTFPRTTLHFHSAELPRLRFRHAHLNSCARRKLIHRRHAQKRRRPVQQCHRAIFPLRTRTHCCLHDEIGNVNRSECHNLLTPLLWLQRIGTTSAAIRACRATISTPNWPGRLLPALLLRSFRAEDDFREIPAWSPASLANAPLLRVHPRHREAVQMAARASRRSESARFHFASQTTSEFFPAPASTPAKRTFLRLLPAPAPAKPFACFPPLFGSGTTYPMEFCAPLPAKLRPNPRKQIRSRRLAKSNPWLEAPARFFGSVSTAICANPRLQLARSPDRTNRPHQ